MEENPDIVRISVPFVCGVGAAALAGAPQASAAAALAGAVACLVAGTARQGRTLFAMIALFFCLGAFCWSSEAVLPDIRPSAGGLPPPRGLFQNPLPPGGGSPPAEAALAKLSEIIARIPFAHPETNALLRALLTGQRDLLGRETIASFRAAGASHILALSGLHLGIIYLIISTILRIIGNSPAAFTIRSLVSVGLCGFYTVMTGASPSTVRALIFIALNELARHSPGRRKTPLGVWCTAAMLQLAVKPSVISSLGFQLSYLAMLGIFLLFPAMKDWYPGAGRSRDRFDIMHRIWDSMALTISCQAFTAPLVWIRFHTFPKYFLLTNLIALPLAEALIAGGVACTALEAVGIRLRFLTEATDWISCTLTRVLRTIASC